jgi:hypothetical protein
LEGVKADKVSVVAPSAVFQDKRAMQTARRTTIGGR